MIEFVVRWPGFLIKGNIQRGKQKLSIINISIILNGNQSTHVSDLLKFKYIFGIQFTLEIVT